MNKEKKKTRTINLRVAEELFLALQEYCIQTGATKTGVIVTLLHKKLGVK